MIFRHHGINPTISPIWYTFVQSMPNDGKFIFFVWCIDPMTVSVWEGRGRRIEQFFFFCVAIDPTPRTPPLPVFTGANEFCADGIAFDIFDE